MATERVRLERVMETSLITLYGKAIDARRTPSILGDVMAIETMRGIDYDFARLRAAKLIWRSAAARAKHLDDWTREFLARHDRATVVHLGCGLDTRPWRITTGPEVDWFDVDQPEVIELRRRLFPARDNYRMIAASVTEPGWLEQIPAAAPVLVVAEGLAMYLQPAAGHDLFRRITERFERGTVIFDGLSRLALLLIQRFLPSSLGTGLLQWPIVDPRELETAAPGIRCVDAVSGVDAPSTRNLGAHIRILAAVARPIPQLRELLTYFRYEFGPRGSGM
jgi:O-methyltransferase involved in polyketide biosynthesis